MANSICSHCVYISVEMRELESVWFPWDQGAGFHGITECLGSEGTSKPSSFQPRTTGRDASTCPGWPKPHPTLLLIPFQGAMWVGKPQVLLLPLLCSTNTKPVTPLNPVPVLPRGSVFLSFLQLFSFPLTAAVCFRLLGSVYDLRQRNQIAAVQT